MGAIKEIIDLAVELEKRVKDRRDLDAIRMIHTLAFTMQTQQIEVVEKDLKIMEENSALKKKVMDLEASVFELKNKRPQLVAPVMTRNRTDSD
jgi:regulator of protease activity HflC (stomatin/prohibitin superfamily)